MQLFLKAPRPGLVKTRLAKEIGEARATGVYKKLVRNQHSRLPAKLAVEIHYTPSEARSEFCDWLGEALAYYPQANGGLGERLETAIEAAFTRGMQRVLCIGGDCPGLGEAQIEHAIRLLDAGKDAVFGPTEDGGYYLVGLRAPQAELFRQIPWSAANTLETSLQKARMLGLEVALLETLYDIDEAKDLERAINEGLVEL